MPSLPWRAYRTATARAGRPLQITAGVAATPPRSFCICCQLLRTQRHASDAILCAGARTVAVVAASQDRRYSGALASASHQASESPNVHKLNSSRPWWMRRQSQAQDPQKITPVLGVGLDRYVLVCPICGTVVLYSTCFSSYWLSGHLGPTVARSCHTCWSKVRWVCAKRYVGRRMPVGGGLNAAVVIRNGAKSGGATVAKAGRKIVRRPSKLVLRVGLRSGEPDSVVSCRWNNAFWYSFVT